MNAVLIIDKPAGITSHDVVSRVRRLIGQRSVGHLGTLDPMATGVLPLVMGNFTRLAQFYTHSDKTYEGVIRFGFSTDTYDAEGEPTSSPQEVSLSAAQLEDCAAGFRGAIMQIPPSFSAKKIGGVPAYKLARKNKDVSLEPVAVEIRQLEIELLEGNCAAFRAQVTSGTYMRSLAHDMGEKLGCGAHLQSLRRTSVAGFGLSEAHNFDELDAAIKGNCLDSLCIHPRLLLPQLPSVTANEEMAARIRNGRSVNLPELSRARQVKVFAGQTELIAIATRVAGTLFHAKIVLAAEAAVHLTTQS
jgi:tRNA pseudouridine55 synthase